MTRQRPKASGESGSELVHANLAVFPYHNHGRARGGLATVRPVGGRGVEGGVVSLARVLDVDHDAVVVNDWATGLCAGRNCEEALQLAAGIAAGGDRI